MPTDKRPLKVFLCHAHADRDPVRRLYSCLTQDGVDAWLDKAKLLPGQDWELEIRKAVREADVVVVCLSKQFNEDGFRQREVKWALNTAMDKKEGSIFIIPARLEECDTLESLRKWHWVDLFEDDGYEMLMRALRVRADKAGARFNETLTDFQKTNQFSYDKFSNNRNLDQPLADIRIIEKGQLLEGRYRIKRIVSVTDYSQVVEAWDEVLTRKVAIKSMYLSRETNASLVKFKNRFVREAEILAGLKHVGIAAVYDVIKDPIAIVMEWIEGTSLQDYFDQPRVFSLSDVVRVGIVLADALSYVHHNQIIHRDIKPSNIIIDTSNQPVLMGFGIAHIVYRENIARQEDGSYFYVGTPKYSAPEQWVDPEHVSVKTDIFSLGMVLYEMLTLNPPFLHGGNPLKYKNSLLPVPDKYHIPNKLFDVLYKMLSQDPNQRPSAVTLRDELKLLQY